MKSLTTAFSTGNLRPKERVLLQVHNEVAKETTGKERLSEADLYALGEGWHTASNDEAREYNRYIEGWRLMNAAELDAQTTYLGATTALLRVSRLVDMAVSKDGEKTIDFCKTFTRHLEDKEGALELVLKNSGLELQPVVHRYAFESLSEDLRADILALDPDAETEGQYLSQEEDLAELFNGKHELMKETKEKLADLIVASLRNEHSAFFTKLGSRDELQKPYFFSGYYASLPAFEILGKWAVYFGQMPQEADDLLQHLSEDKEYANEGEEVVDLFSSIRKELLPRLTAYAAERGKDVGAILKETLLRWLDDGLFTKDFAPIWNSKNTNTCNGVDTKRPHKDVFAQWLKAKRKAEQTIRGLIDSGELQVEDRVEVTRRLFRNDETESDDDCFMRTLTIITGESMYALTGDYAFADDYRKQADDLAGLGALVLFLRERGFLKQYGVLLAFSELFKKLSVSYEIDLTYKVSGHLTAFKDDIRLLNSELSRVAETLRHASYEKHSAAFLIDVFVEDMLIDIDQVELNPGPTDRYYKELEQQLGGEFRSYE